MQWSWFDLAWPWIGLVASGLLLAVLFGTRRLQQNTQISRWRDPVWLAWLMSAVYMLHNFEEYGIDALGQHHAFPISACAALHQPPYPACLLPPGFYLGVNLSAIWAGSVLCAILSRRNKAVGLAYAGLLITNGLSHFGSFAAGKGYNPGLVTAVVLFFPLFYWVAKTCFGTGRLSYWVLASIVLAGTVLSVVLLGSMQARVHGYIGDTTLILIQIINPIWFFLFPWLAGRKWPQNVSNEQWT